MQLILAHPRWVMPSFPRRDTKVLECYLARGLMITLPFQGHRSGLPCPCALRRKIIQLFKDVLDSSDRIPRVLSARRFPRGFQAAVL